MKVSSVDIFRFNIQLKHPTRVPIGVLDAARNVIVRINTDAGICGWGEASPFGPITGESQDSNLASAKMLAALIKGRDPLARETLSDEMRRSTVGDTSILSAFDMALFDIAGKVSGLPVYKLLGGENRLLRSDITIGMQDSIDETIKLLDERLASGFDAVKLKVGRAGLADSDYVAAVREHVGPAMPIKIDSNQGWDYPTALANLRTMEKLNIEYSEQPTLASDHTSLRRLRDNTSIPICADESVFNDSDALKLVTADAVDYLNIKLGKSGGIGVGIRIEAIARAANRKCMIGCFAESRIGLTAAAHLAIARPNIEFIDLDSSFGFEVDPIVGGASFDENNGGRIIVDDSPGFGASLSDEFAESCHWATV